MKILHRYPESDTVECGAIATVLSTVAINILTQIVSDFLDDIMNKKSDMTEDDLVESTVDTVQTGNYDTSKWPAELIKVVNDDGQLTEVVAELVTNYLKGSN